MADTPPPHPQRRVAHLTRLRAGPHLVGGGPSPLRRIGIACSRRVPASAGGALSGGSGRWQRSWQDRVPRAATLRARANFSRLPEPDSARVQRKLLAKPGTPPRNKVRFLWFGGEEDGLVGSQYYAAHLPNAEVARTDVMIDTDMIASPNFVRLVYDGDGNGAPGNPAGPAGSGTVENVFVRYWAQRGLSSEPIPFDGRSNRRRPPPPGPRRPRANTGSSTR
jgi:hypothetical protein